MKLCKLKKAVLIFKNRPVPFLNGLTSNDMDQSQNAFLNIHGRIIATFDQKKMSEDEFMIVMEKPFVEGILQHLDHYVKLSGVKIEPLDVKVYFDFDQEAKITPHDWTIPQKKGRLIITKDNLLADVSWEAFTLFRLKNNIPMHGVDYNDELLLNVSDKDFVSFTKGCYLGQEPISKVHSRSCPSWKLVVRYEDELSETQKQKMTSKTIDPDTQRILGFIFVSNKE